MRRRAGLTVAALVLGVCAPTARAQIIEVGRSDATPSCPKSPCVAISRTTGYQVRVGSDGARFVVPADGKIVAWSITLGSPSKRQIAFFDKREKGKASAQLSVLRLAKTRQAARVVTQSPLERLEPYFGGTVQFPLDRTLNVRKGYVIALTVPTWAPALTDLYKDRSGWRASRPPAGCADTITQTAQTHLKDLARYRCQYRARLTYSATLITRPRPRVKP